MQQVSYEELKQKIKECNYFGNFSILRNLDTSNISDFSYLFQDCENLKDLNFAFNWELSNATTVEGIFKNCINLSDISGCINWDLSNINPNCMKDVFLYNDKIDLISKNLFLRKQMSNDFMKQTYQNLNIQQLESLYDNIICTINSI